MGDSGREIKGVSDHFGGFRAWIPERSDFFKGPEGPKGPLGPERSDFFKGPLRIPKMVPHLGVPVDFLQFWHETGREWTKLTTT